MHGLITVMRNGRVMRTVLPGALTALVVAAPLGICGAAPRHKKTNTIQAVPGIKTIALFATTNSGSPSGAVAASELDSALKMRLNATGYYQATSFSSRLPSIQRALTESAGGAGTLTTSDIQTPVTEPSSALKIARVMATDGYMLDEVDSYREDPASRAVSVTVSGSLYSADSGSAVRTYAVTGSAAPLTADEGAASITQRAVNSAAAQIVSTFGVSSGDQSSAEIPNTSYSRSHSGGSILLVALAGLMVGIIASNSNRHGGSNNNGQTIYGNSGNGSSSGGSSSGIPGSPPI